MNKTSRIKNKNTLQDAKNLFYKEYDEKELSIGEYQEKAIHSILKHYYENDINNMEIKIKPYIADIKNEYGIIEIQTRGFNKLRNKLDSFLKENEVTIVYPALYNKSICWLGSENEKDLMRKSPRHQDIFYCFKEFYKIKTYLNNNNLHICIVFLEAIEFKNLDGYDSTKKKRASSYDKLPLNILEERYISSYKDFLYIFDDFKNDETFTVKSLAKRKHANVNDVRITCTCLSYLGLIKKVDQIGKQYVYIVNRDIGE